jgi:hypothetical protein
MCKIVINGTKVFVNWNIIRCILCKFEINLEDIQELVFLTLESGFCGEEFASAFFRCSSNKTFIN